MNWKYSRNNNAYGDSEIFYNGVTYKSQELSERSIKNCKNQQIKNRYVLQVMRKYYYDKRYNDVVKIWKKYGSSIPQGALRTTCLNYYGGALLESEKKNDASVVYASIGFQDQHYMRYSADVLSGVYNQQPNNKHLDFMLQMFVDGYFDSKNKRFKRKEVEKFNALVDKVISEQKTNNPAMWKSAQAAIAYIDKDINKAIFYLSQADSMKGTRIAKDNIRMMQLVFNSSRTDIDSIYEETILPDLKWLANNVKSDVKKSGDYCDIDYYWNIFGNNWYDDYYKNNNKKLNYYYERQHRYKILRRVILCNIVPHFERLNQEYKSIAYMNLYYKTTNLSNKGYFYSGDLFQYLDNASIESILQYVNFIRNGGSSQSDKFVISNSYRDLNIFYELIGTKYMREQQYQKAAYYLGKVSKKYSKNMNIASYINKNRNPFREKWITKKDQCGKFGLDFDPAAEYDKNPSKLAFCKIMQKLQKEMNHGKTQDQRSKAAYAYSVGLHQSTIGKSWALNFYFWTSDITKPWDDKPVSKKNLTNVDKFDITYHFNGFKNTTIFYDCQQNVDKYLNTALKYSGDKNFTLKCKVLHSKERKNLRTKKKIQKSWGIEERETFNNEVRRTFCDKISDY